MPDYEISLEVAEEDVADEMQLDSVNKKKKGRGFGTVERGLFVHLSDPPKRIF
jgi:hypothetical protein